MRSTQSVVGAEEGTRLGHYSDPPMLVLASLANGPKHGHAMIEDIVRLCGTRLGPGTLYGGLPVWNSRVGLSHFHLRSAAGPIALPLRVCAFCAQN
jgi:hypothetical protein